MKTILLILINFLAISCATGENFGSIEEGMSKNQVMQILGKQDQISQNGNGWVTYYYKDRLISGWSWDKTDYHIVFDPNGKVYEYGHGPVDTRTSERMSQWSAQQQQLNNSKSIKNIDCSSYTVGSITNTHCDAD